MDGSVASLDHFSGAEERVSHKGWDNVGGTCWFTQFVVQFVDFSCSCRGTIREMEQGRQDCVCGNQWGGVEECVGRGSRVADCQGDGSVGGGHTKCRWGRLGFIVVDMGAPFPFLVVGAVPVDVVNGESKLPAFVGLLSSRKNCFDAVELCAMVGEWGPIVAQDDG